MVPRLTHENQFNYLTIVQHVFEHRPMTVLSIWNKIYYTSLLFFFLKEFLYYLFIYIFGCVGSSFLCEGFSLVAASRGHSSSRCAGLALSRPLLLRSTSSRRAGSVVVAHGPSCSAACRIFPDQGSNPCPLHWQADSQPLRHQGSPPVCFGVLSSDMPFVEETAWPHCRVASTIQLRVFPILVNCGYLEFSNKDGWISRSSVPFYLLSLGLLKGWFLPETL